MLVLLPPSEGKATPGPGAAVDLSALAFPELAEQRERLLDAVDPGLRDSPAAPACEVYTGVLYQRLDLPSLPARSRGRVLIASGLWGFVRPDDRIPAYKLPIGEKVPGIGGLAAFWRPALREALPDAPGLVLDLRSAAYAAVWRPERATVLGVRGFTEGAGGTRKVISHMAKRVRGDVARAVLGSRRVARTPEDVAALAEAQGMRVELSDGTLDVIESP